MTLSLTVPRSQLAKLQIHLKQGGNREIGGWLVAEQTAPGKFELVGLTVDLEAGTRDRFTQLFQINPTTGNLTLTSSVTATSQSARGDADVYVKPDGTVYLAYSNSSAEEVVLYRVGVGGTLTQTDSLVGQGDYNALHSKVNYIEGEPIVVVTDVTGSMTRLYSISADGTICTSIIFNGTCW